MLTPNLAVRHLFCESAKLVLEFCGFSGGRAGGDLIEAGGDAAGVALSGGVDSAVAAVLVHRAIGDRG